MARCPNCAGELLFDIKSQSLKCQQCDSGFNPYDTDKTVEGVVQEYYDTQVFTCPQCGAEIESTDFSGTGFCAYCGSSVVFTSRMKQAEMLQKIIPFQLTKEDCKKRYQDKVRSAMYHDKELENPQYLERFVGYYLPYWLYNFEMDEPLQLEGMKEYQSGNYQFHERYSLSGRLQGSFKNIPFDASTRFDDTIAGCIAPFTQKNLKEFSPNFLLGFYSDVADADAKQYESEAFRLVEQQLWSSVMGNQGFQESSMILNHSSLKSLTKLGAKSVTVERGMFPVWFLSYKKDNRIAYAVVNGETGRVYCDIPIDERKFHKASLMMAIPIFILLNLFLQIKADILPWFTLALSTLLIFLAQGQITKIKKREDSLVGNQNKPKAEKEKLLQHSGTGYAVFSVLFSLAILIWNPVQDEYYYLASAVSGLMSILTLRLMIKKFNILSTRSIPEFFDKKGVK